jgi:hypothetical protein
MSDPELDRFMTELASAMDNRIGRIGEHVAKTHPAWATLALGDVPDDPLQRADWQERASSLGAYREMYGYDAANDAIGPEPARTSPEARADWHDAFAVLGSTEAMDLRGCSDAQLNVRRDAY